MKCLFFRHSSGSIGCPEYWRARHTDDPENFPLCWSGQHEHYSGSPSVSISPPLATVYTEFNNLLLIFYNQLKPLPKSETHSGVLREIRFYKLITCKFFTLAC